MNLWGQVIDRLKYKRAIGLEVKKGRPPKGKKPSKAELRKLYIQEFRSIRKIAEVLKCSKDMVYRALDEYGIEMRSKARRSQLRIYKREHLKKKIMEAGYKHVATELGVGITTLRDYMRKSE